jgi:hypothetical protein
VTTAVVHHHRRPLLPTFTLLVASAAAVLGVIAIAADDVVTITPTEQRPADAAVPNAPGIPAASGMIIDEFDTCVERTRVNGPC